MQRFQDVDFFIYQCLFIVLRLQFTRLCEAQYAPYLIMVGSRYVKNLSARDGQNL